MRDSLYALVAGLWLLLPLAAVKADTLMWRPLVIDGHSVRWIRPVASSKGLMLSWRLAGAPETYADAVNCRRIEPLDELAARSGYGPATLRRELVAAFEMWSRAADISFVEAAPGAAADITIGAQSDPVGRAFADVAYDKDGAGPVRAITRALVCLNPTVRWKTGFDGDLSTYDLRYTLAHEIGHAIGLDHPDGPGSLMWFRYTEQVSQLQNGDIAGAVSMYGTARPLVERALVRAR